MVLRCIKIIIPACFLLLSACSQQEAANFEATVMGEFALNHEVAARKYRRIWIGYRGNENLDARMVVASELMGYDEGNYYDYFYYVKNNIRKTNGDYRLSAIRALRNAKGIESLNLLFDAYQSGQDAAARTAADVIKIRYRKAKGVYELRSESELIEKRVNALRKAKDAHD